MLPLDDKVVMATNFQTNLWWKMDESNKIIFTHRNERDQNGKFSEMRHFSNKGEDK